MLFILCTEAIALWCHVKSIFRSIKNLSWWVARTRDGITVLNDASGCQAGFFVHGTAKRVAQTLQSTVST